ncbi:cysteine-rich receptor-like protein kinase 8 [Tanacetum coccineum]
MTNTDDTNPSNTHQNHNEDDINSPNHPLYFHPQDHPGMILISRKLTGSDNYSHWKRSMMIALSARNKIKLVNGDFEEPEKTSPIRAYWERANDMLNSSVEVYYHKLKGLWDELDALEAPYTCTCKCVCENGKTNGERDQRKRLIQFLMGLDESYTNLRDPSRNNRPQNINQTQPRRSTFKVGVICGNYYKEGHTKEECYKLVGFPVGHPLHNKYQPPNKRSTTFNQPSTSQSRTRAVNVTVANEDTPVEMTLPPDCSVTAKMDLLQNQLNQVLLMMQNNNAETSTSGSCNFMAGKRLIAHFITKSKEIWIIDSGATDHICISISLMHNIITCINPIIINLPNGQTITCTTIGSVTLQSNITLHNVLYIPTFTYNLISISKILQNTLKTITFTHNSCIFQDHNRLTTQGTLCGDLYILPTSSTTTEFSPPSLSSTILSNTSNSSVWHARLGHPSPQVLKSIPQLPLTSVKDQETSCNICPLAKHQSLPFESSTSHANVMFELVHIDVWGPSHHPTVNKCKIFLTIVDDFSRATWTYLLPTKHHVTSTIKLFYTYVETQFKTKIQKIRSDNGTKFANNTLTEFFNTKGIIHQTSCPYTPQQNARVERKHRHLLEVARALQFQANLPKHLWGYCILTATYLINRLPSKILNYKSPYELLYNQPPPLDHLRTIGCRSYVHQNTSDKFHPRAIPTILIGYPQNQKGYLLYDPITTKVHTSRHVTFDENLFSYHITPITHTQSKTDPQPSSIPFSHSYNNPSI